MIQKPDINIRVKITGIREKAKWGQSHKEHIDKEGGITRWVDNLGWEVWIPEITLDDGTICYGSQVWWQRI